MRWGAKSYMSAVATRSVATSNVPTQHRVISSDGSAIKQLMSAERQVAAFLAKYAPSIVDEMQAARQHLALLFPRGFELVYDNYNTLAFGYSPTDRASGAVVSVAAYPRWV